ncbi:MAG: EpsG family protein [Acetanaerobacterium sp.]
MTTIYYAVLAVLLLVGIPLYHTGQTRGKTLLFLGISLVLLAGVSAVRYEVGDDYYNYMNIFATVRKLPFSDLFSQREPGFFLLNKLVLLFTGHFQWFYAFMAFVTTALVLLFIYRESKIPFLSVFLYVSMMLYYWSLSLIRQMLAAAVCALCVRYIRDRRPLPFLLLVLAAASIHNSALIMLPVYLIAQIPFHWKSVTVICAISLVGFIAAPSIVAFITQYIYTGYTPDAHFGQGSALIYGIFPTFVFAAAWCFKKNLLRQDPSNNVYLNLMLYAAIISLFIARVYIVERFAVYFFLPSIVLIPNMLATLLPSDAALAAAEKAWQALKTLVGTQHHSARRGLRAQLEKIKDARLYFGFAVGCVITITLLYHLFGISHGFFGVKDYQTIFSKQPTERFAASRALYREYLAEIKYPYE